MTRHPAFDRQVTAADPSASTFLSANAGSGKTRVLTDRVARLLLNGVEPQHILCLTYTKAAASEMQNRLFGLLGRWAMMPDAGLRAALQVLGEGDVPDDQSLAAARRLFARAIETPGGLRIQTIHSFCASLLRRFPLEAGVSPQFTELDDRAAKMLRSEIVEELAESRAPAVMAEVALAYSGDDFTALMEQVAGNRAGFATALDDAASQQIFGLSGETAAAIVADVLLGGEAELVAAMIPALAASGPADSKAADRLGALDFVRPNLALLAGLEEVLLTGAASKGPFSAKIGSFPTKPLQKTFAPLMPRLDALMLRVEAARPRRIALIAAQKTATLHRFAAAFLPLYAARKAERGFLDFDDLITRAKLLLTDRSVAEWVLFRLDGGIDHILVDEAQDTSPDQWRVIELLAAEFTAGHGARAGGRTLFVVGDKKQSIYSFQGADVAAFEAKRAEFQQRFEAVGQRFQNEKLEYSFRSAPAILQLVDQCFGPEHLPALGGAVSHQAFRSEKPGRVDLWPLVEPVKTEADENWDDPIGLIRETHQAARLARMIAGEIARMIATGTRIVTADGTRRVQAGDFLILVQRRSDLFGEIIRACKKAGLPIAGADRLKLGAELAVKDLTALLAFLAVPEDDLSLAALLRSPLLGWTEGDLYDLAQGRQGFLWEALRGTQNHPDTLGLLTDLRDRSDYLRPFDLIERVLTRHDGRRRLLARLGPEAEDGIDELLSQALSYEQTEVPSLTGFLIWLDSDEIVVKRQGDSEGSRIRVMTVHGAKGLESEIVILPDCADRTRREHDEIFRTADGVPVWKTAAALSPPLVDRIRAERLAATEAENLRLLYVALTRARCWLIVAAAGKADKPESWYQMVGAAMAGAVPSVQGRLRLETGDWPEPLLPVAPPVPRPEPLPVWLELPVPRPPAPPEPLAPSGLGGAKVLPGEDSGETDAEFGKARGTALHRLLELLPTRPQADWDAIATSGDPAPGADLLAEARRVLAASELAALFGPDGFAELPFTVPFRDRVLIGAMDRVLITPGRLLAVDFKSNRLIPASAAQVPEGLLRQMGAYDHALQLIYPGRRIETAILWTRTAQLMVFPPEIVRAALARATTDGAATLDVAPPGA